MIWDSEDISVLHKMGKQTLRRLRQHALAARTEHPQQDVQRRRRAARQHRLRLHLCGARRAVDALHVRGQEGSERGDASGGTVGEGCGGGEGVVGLEGGFPVVARAGTGTCWREHFGNGGPRIQVGIWAGSPEGDRVRVERGGANLEGTGGGAAGELGAEAVELLDLGGFWIEGSGGRQESGRRHLALVLALRGRRLGLEEHS